MFEAIAVLSCGGPVDDRGLVIDPAGIDLRRLPCPILDSHDRHREIGLVVDAWVEEDAQGVLPISPLMGRLCFYDTKAGRAAHGMIERQEICGVSIGIEITEVAISEPDGTPLSVEEAIERGYDDPDLLIIAKRSILTEVSLTSMPGDPNAVVRAVGEDVLVRQMIKDGEAKLRRILNRETEQDWRDLDPQKKFERVLWDRRLVHYGAPEPIIR
jgi:hypothetical protein